MPIQKIENGSQFWDVPINANFAEIDATLKKLVGGTVTHLDDPVTWLNGYSGHSNAEVFTISGKKLVYLRLRPDNRDSINNGDVIGILPNSLANDISVSYIELDGDANLACGAVSNGKDDDGSVQIHVWSKNAEQIPMRYIGFAGLYIAKNN